MKKDYSAGNNCGRWQNLAKMDSRKRREGQVPRPGVDRDGISFSPDPVLAAISNSQSD